MKFLLILATALVALAGCDSALFDDDARAAIRKRMKDPDSVKFEEKITFNQFTCIRYNAKNSYGAYTGASWTILERESYGFRLVEDNVDYCSEAKLRDLAFPEKAAEKARASEKAVTLLRDRQLVPSTATDLWQLASHPCHELGQELALAMHRIIDADTTEQKARYQREYDKLLARVEQGQCKPA